MLLITLIGANGYPCYLTDEHGGGSTSAARVFIRQENADAFLAKVKNHVAYQPPEAFTPGFAERLNAAKVVSLSEANTNRETLGLGWLYIADGSYPVDEVCSLALADSRTTELLWAGTGPRLWGWRIYRQPWNGECFVLWCGNGTRGKGRGHFQRVPLDECPKTVQAKYAKVTV